MEPKPGLSLSHSLLRLMMMYQYKELLKHIVLLENYCFHKLESVHHFMRQDKQFKKLIEVETN